MQVTSSTNTSGAAADLSSVLPQQVLGQDDFLKLLIAQLTSQDPMNPLSNAEFITQMAQFSTLEQSRTMGTALASLRLEQQITQANALLGKTVTLLAEDGTVTGVVDSIAISGGTPQIVVNGTGYNLDQVVSIRPTDL